MITAATGLVVEIELAAALAAGEIAGAGIECLPAMPLCEIVPPRFHQTHGGSWVFRMSSRPSRSSPVSLTLSKPSHPQNSPGVLDVPARSSRAHISDLCVCHYGPQLSC